MGISNRQGCLFWETRDKDYGILGRMFGSLFKATPHVAIAQNEDSSKCGLQGEARKLEMSSSTPHPTIPS